MKKVLLVVVMICLVGGISLAWDGERSDFNNDGVVNLQDAVLLLSHYGEHDAMNPDGSYDYPAYDINKDGITNLFDAVTMLGDYGKKK